MTRILLLSLLAPLLSVTACRSHDVGYDAKASAAYRAAWDKKMAGDEAGYRAGLEQVKKEFPDTRAGARASERLAAKK
jgi:hypothetical protein